MPEIPSRDKVKTQPSTDCPGCKYSPLAEPNTDPPETIEDLLDFYQVVGCDDGYVMCPQCGLEIAISLLRLPPLKDYEATKFDGGANL